MLRTHHFTRIALTECAALVPVLIAANPIAAQPITDHAIKQEVIRLIHDHYFRPVEIDTSLGADSIVSQLDPHSSYQRKVEADRFNANLNNEEFHGFGLWTMRTAGSCYVDYVRQYDCADVAGVRAGDKILEIGGHAIDEMSDSAITAFLWDRGEWAFELHVYRPSIDDTFRLWVTRNFKTIFPNLDFGMIDDTTGVVRMNEFAQGVANELMSAVDKLHARGMTSLILDLRGNPGGFVNELINCERLFVGGTTRLLSERSADSEENVSYAADGMAPYATLPLVVLVDHDSWSATELLTGSLQDLDRALVVGEPTGGKGLVMRRFTLMNGDQVYLAVGGAILPSGRCPQALYDHDKYIMPRFDLPTGDNTDHRNDDYYSEMPCRTFSSAHGRHLSWHQGIIPDIIVPPVTEYLPEWYLALLDTIAVIRLRDSDVQYNVWGLNTFKSTSHYSASCCARLEHRLEQADTTPLKHITTYFEASLEKNLEWRTAVRIWGYEASLQYEGIESPIFRRALLEPRVTVLTGPQ